MIFSQACINTIPAKATMRIVFAKDSLARICTDQAHKMGLPFTIIKGARKTLIKLESAEFESDLYNLGG